jgi:hypothetical protein
MIEACYERGWTDGLLSEDWRAVEGDIEVSTTVGEHTFLVRQN